MSIYKTTPDNDLLLLLKQDDRYAFEELYERHWLSLYNVAYKRLKEREASKDIVQDVFADFWLKRNTKEISKLLPYLHTAVRYKIYTLLAKGHATTHFIEPFENMMASPFTADGYLADKELKSVFSYWLQTLPEKRREIFRLRYIEEISTQDIGTKLNISQKTVQNQLGIAFQNLRNFIAILMISSSILAYLLY
ncbi:MAG TPA: sigma-70 family RNA polymerase sigma factor [Sphingobacteriaceae bacterium]